MNKILESIKKRRSYYSISPVSTVSDAQLEEIIKTALKNTPTSFNSQTGRAVLLLGDYHKTLWEIVLDCLREVTDVKRFPTTQKKIAGFAAGYGSIMFFEETAKIEELQNNFPLYADRFPLWSQQSSGMLQLIVWSSLEEEGLGASLQHYNPLIDERVKAEYNIPESWRLISQMPFGKPTEEPLDKTFLPIEERFRVFK